MGAPALCLGHQLVCVEGELPAECCSSPSTGIHFAFATCVADSSKFSLWDHLTLSHVRITLDNQVTDHMRLR